MKPLVAFSEKIAHALRDVPALLARLALAAVFIPSGWGKLHHLDQVAGFFASLGIPFASVQAPFIAMVELLGGLALLVGWGARTAAFFLSCTMVVAILTAKLPDAESWIDLLGMSEFLYLLLLAFVAVEGPGRYSVKKR